MKRRKRKLNKINLQLMNGWLELEPSQTQCSAGFVVKLGIWEGTAPVRDWVKGPPRLVKGPPQAGDKGKGRGAGVTPPMFKGVPAKGAPA
eukprot:8263033-Karenia_brevis.AAC.1